MQWNCSVNHCRRLRLPLLALIFCCLSLSPSILFSAQVDLSSFLDEVQSASDKITSFSSSFTQERHLALFAKPVIFHGKLTIVRPDKLRWEFIDPVPSVIIFNGDKGIRCNEHNSQNSFDLGSDPVMKSVAEQLWLWLGGDYAKLNKRFLIKMKGNHTLIITPKEQAVSEYIAAVTIKFNEITNRPERVEIVEPGGDLTRIIFHSYVVNMDVPEALFSRCGEK